MCKATRVIDFFALMPADYEFVLNSNQEIMSVTDSILDNFNTRLHSAKDLLGINFAKIIKHLKFEIETLEKVEIFLNKKSSFGVVILNGILPDCPGLHYPALMIFFVKSEKLEDGTQKIKLFNYIKLTRTISNIFGKDLNILSGLTEQLSSSLQEKSLYFAFNSLKHISAIVPFVEAENCQAIRYPLLPFHKVTKNKNKSANEINYEIYRKEFKRYIAHDEYHQMAKIGIYSQLFTKEYNCIPMSRLKNNIFISIF